MNDKKPTGIKPIDALVSARDAARKLQQLASKLALPAEHRAALTDGVTKLMMPGEQLQAMVDLAEAFGPPQAQVAEIKQTLADQREQLAKMAADLDKVEAAVDRLATASEKLAALQSPFLRAMRNLTSAPDDDADPETDTAEPTRDA